MFPDRLLEAGRAPCLSWVIRVDFDLSAHVLLAANLGHEVRGPLRRAAPVYMAAG